MKYKYSMFIDDERYPTEDRNWWVARSSGEACKMVEKMGMPEHISFDHDLGDIDTSMIFLDWLSKYAMDNGVPFDFTYYVHSQNPVGAKNIEGFIESFRSIDQKPEAP